LVFPVIVVQTNVGWFFEISKNCRFEFFEKIQNERTVGSGYFRKLKELMVL
jgi:hypothetical protein